MDAVNSAFIFLLASMLIVSGHARGHWDRPRGGFGRERPFSGRQGGGEGFRRGEGALFRQEGEARFDPSRFGGLRFRESSRVEGGELGSRRQEDKPHFGSFQHAGGRSEDRRDGPDRRMPPRPFHNMMGRGRHGEEDGPRGFSPHPHHHRHHSPHPHHHHHHQHHHEHHHHHGNHNESEESSQERDFNGTSIFPFRDAPFRRPPFWHRGQGKRNCTKNGRGDFSRDDRPGRWQWRHDGEGPNHHNHHGRRNDSGQSSEERDNNGTSIFPVRDKPFRRPPFWVRHPGRRNFTDGQADSSSEDRSGRWQWKQDVADVERPGRDNMYGGRSLFRRPGPGDPRGNRGSWHFGHRDVEEPDSEDPPHVSVEISTDLTQTEMIQEHNIGSDNDIYKVDVNE